MFCPKCRCEQVVGAQFCRQCGAQLAATPLPHPPVQWPPAAPVAFFAPSMRVRQNLQPLGIMWCLFGAYRIVAIAIAGFVLHTLALSGVFGGQPHFVSQLMSAMMPVVALITTIMGGAAILTGYALLTRRPWARALAIVVGILALIKIPFGTALGIYTLWVLVPQASGNEWDVLTSTQG